MAKCTAYSRTLKRGCGADAVARTSWICAHEHVQVDRLSCQEHLTLGTMKAMYCRECAEHPTDPHECLLTLVASTPLAEEEVQPLPS